MHCAVKFSKNGFVTLAYQSRGKGNAVICDRDDGRLWWKNNKESPQVQADLQ